MSEDFFIVQSATTIKITNKVHLHSQKNTDIQQKLK